MDHIMGGQMVENCIHGLFPTVWSNEQFLVYFSGFLDHSKIGDVKYMMTKSVTNAKF